MAKSRRRSDKEIPERLEYKRLPYDFVPFDKDQYRFPYTSAASPDDGRMSLPRHDRVEAERLSGELRYRMIPHSDLVVEVREKWGGGHFISGSVMRGKIRSNAEMLSLSYPEFVNRAQLMYRDIQSPAYKKRLFGLEKSGQNQDPKGIEHYIRVGYLQKVDGKFYIIPAEKFGDKYFLSIHEHRLRRMDVRVEDENFPWLYCWNDKTIENLDQLQAEIDQLTLEIKKVREPYRDLLENNPMSGWFVKCMAFSKIQKDIKKAMKILIKEKKRVPRRSEIEKEILDCRREHLNDLVESYILEKGLSEPQASDIRKIYSKTFERWKLKWEVETDYQNRARNTKFKPYQNQVSFDLDENFGVCNLSLCIEKYSHRGILYNSTNASSKRSHYLIKLPDQSASMLPVEDKVINAYNRNFKRIRFTDASKFEASNEELFENFYNLFEKYDKLSQESEPIVFFRTDQNGEVKDLARTPHMKILYKSKLEDLLGTKPNDGVDYASALFGYVAESQSDAAGHAYKSRVLFQPVVIKGNPEKGKKTKHFILMTPQPTAAGMYLRQDGIKKKTYEDSADTIQLNGLKYYHVRQKEKDPNAQNAWEKFSSARKVYCQNSLEELNGTIVFKNLTPAELGLLLLAADIRLIRYSKHWDMLQKSHSPFTIDESFLNRCFELIGGAKPYGYGKVRVELLDLRLDKADYDFETLMVDGMTAEPEENWRKYIDAFLDDMGGEAFVQSELFGAYLVSKFEIDDKEFGEQDIADWDVKIQPEDNSKSKDNRVKPKDDDKKVKESTGYGKNWVLKRRYQTSQP